VASCIAVGGATDRHGVITIAEVWDGTDWHLEAMPAPKRGTKPFLERVACTSDAACTAVGGYRKQPSGKLVTLAERWDGSAWTIQHTPNPGKLRVGALYGVACTSSSACIAVGGPFMAFAESWDGSTWTIQNTPNPPDASDSVQLLDIACPRLTACTAVGYYFPESGGAESLAEGWDGTVWTIHPTPKFKQNYGLFGVACARARTCQAVGFHGQKTLAEGK
jgi:hypothetical protein